MKRWFVYIGMIYKSTDLNEYEEKIGFIVAQTVEGSSRAPNSVILGRRRRASPSGDLGFFFLLCFSL